MVNVLADKYLYNIESYFADDVNLELFDPDVPLNEIPAGTQALLIRTVTKINPQTFPSLPKTLKFIGTGSAGSDHVDIPYLNEQDITFGDAAGCNAHSVAEYVATTLLLWADAKDINIKENTVGIIGVGHTGGEVQRILRNMGINIVSYDPPRQERDPSFQSATLAEVLQSDILTFHTPLNREQPYATFHWLDKEKLANNTFKLIINAARGGIIDEKTLLKVRDENRIEDFILDVWEGEPKFNDNVARQAFLKTPHIAGYSLQAKNRATRLIAEKLADRFNINLCQSVPQKQHSPIDTPPSTFWSLTDALTFFHPVRDYETRFLMLIGRNLNHKSKGFNHIRTHHPLRTELQLIKLPEGLKKTYPVIQPLFSQ